MGHAVLTDGQHVEGNLAASGRAALWRVGRGVVADALRVALVALEEQRDAEDGVLRVALVAERLDVRLVVVGIGRAGGHIITHQRLAHVTVTILPPPLLWSLITPSTLIEAGSRSHVPGA